jgi:peptidoglycan/LPS O-acetylase OafA/YrhL
MNAFARFLDVKRFGSLDGLRCLAILYVIWHHSPVELAAPFANRGFMGVHLFFAISGFLITSLMIRERAKTGTISLSGFYWRRSLRIFPLYYAMVGVYIVAVLLLEQGPDAAEFFANLPYFLTYTSNWFVQDDGRVIFFFAWSLALEEQFYLTWPWVERYAKPLPKFALLAALAAIAPAIVFGVALAHLLHSPRGFALAWRLLGHRASAPVALLVTVALLSIHAEGRAIEHLRYASLALLVASCVIREDNGLARLLQFRPLVRIGVASYGIYLMHQLAMNAVEKVTNDRWSVLLVATALAWLAAEISFATFERFFLRLKSPNQFTRNSRPEGSSGTP